MGISRLRALLERRAGFEDLQFVIPHPLLPPRFRKVSRSRNMVLLIDTDLTLHVRWEGEQMCEHCPLTKGAARQLVREVLQNMKAYRRELAVYARFIEDCAEQPSDDHRYELPRLPRELPTAPQEETKGPEEDPEVEVVATVLLEPSGDVALGGENPLPEWNY